MASRTRGLALALLALALLGPAGCKGRASKGKDGRASDAALARGDAAAAPGEDDPRPEPLPACAAATSPAPPEGPISASATLRVHLGADPGELDPFDESNRFAPTVLAGLVFEPLLGCAGRDAAATGPAPGLAEAAELGPAGDTITLRLRPRAVFHDGKPVSAVDVRASIDAVWRGGARMPQTRAALADLAGMDLAPGNGLRLRLRRPAPIVLRALCDVPIAPAGQIAALRRGAVDPVGTGPFRFEERVRGKLVRLVRALRPGLPAAALAEIRFEVVPDAGRALGRLRRGELDLYPQLAGAHYPDQVRPAALGPGLVLFASPGERESFLAVNHKRAPLGDKAVRRALSLLWDRAGLGVELHAGLVTPIAAPTFAALPAPVFDPVASPAAASETLRAAGFLPREAQPRIPAIRFRLTALHTGGRNAKAELRRFAERVRRIGIFLELQQVELPVLAERLRTGDFDLALGSWQGRPFEDPHPRFGRHGPFNYGGFESATLEALLDELRVTDGPATRAALDQRLGALLGEELPAIFLYRHTELAVASRHVQGLCQRGGRLDFSAARLAPGSASP